MALAAEKLKSSLQLPRGLLAPDAANQTVVIPGNFRLMSRMSESAEIIKSFFVPILRKFAGTEYTTTGRS